MRREMKNHPSCLVTESPFNILFIRAVNNRSNSIIDSDTSSLCFFDSLNGVKNALFITPSFINLLLAKKTVPVKKDWFISNLTVRGTSFQIQAYKNTNTELKSLINCFSSSINSTCDSFCFSDNRKIFNREKKDEEGLQNATKLSIFPK